MSLRRHCRCLSYAAVKDLKDGALVPLVGPAKIRFCATVAVPLPPFAMGRIPVTSVLARFILAFDAKPLNQY